MHPYHQAQSLIGLVYVHPVSKQLVVFTDHDCVTTDTTLTWRLVTGEGRGRVLVSTVLKGDGRWIKYEGVTNVLPYSHRS